MPNELINAKITHVSYVDKAANQKRFLLTKSETKPDFTKEVSILVKSEDPKKLVYGVVYEPEVEDTQGDFMTAEEIEKAAHEFMAEYRGIDLQHNFEDGYGQVVESYIASEDFNVGESTVTKGSWVLVSKASDEVWEKIQKGEITGYSMGGTAERLEKSQEEKDSEAVGWFMNMVKKAFTNETVKKGQVKDSYNKQVKSENFWSAWYALRGVLSKYDYYEDEHVFEEDPEKIREALEEFSEIVNSLLQPGVDIAKSIAKSEETKKEEEEMNSEQIKKAIEEALSPINEKLDNLEKEYVAKSEEPKEDPVAKEEGLTEENLTEIIKQAISPLTNRIETVEKARGIQKSEDVESNEEDVTKSDSVFAKLFQQKSM